MDIQFGTLHREEIKSAADIAARAYQDYDYVTLYFPDAEERRRGLQAFMNCLTKTNFGRADLLAARQEGRLVARAALESPSYRQPSLWQFILHGGFHIYLTANWRRVNGFLAMDEGASKPCHDYQQAGQNVWYLSMIEVEPSAQGQGIGTLFLAYLEDYVREHGGKEFILFTNSNENLAWYTKRGYGLFHECEIEHDGRRIGSWSLKKVL